MTCKIDVRKEYRQILEFIITHNALKKAVALGCIHGQSSIASPCRKEKKSKKQNYHN